MSNGIENLTIWQQHAERREARRALAERLDAMARGIEGPVDLSSLEAALRDTTTPQSRRLRTVARRLRLSVERNPHALAEVAK